MARNQKTPKEIHFCRECAHVTVVDDFFTLSLDGKPTLGKCEYWTSSKCVLLSQRSCSFFKL